MNKQYFAYLLGCIDPEFDKMEMTDEDLYYYSNSIVQIIIDKMKMLCFKYAILQIDKKSLEEEYNKLFLNYDLNNDEKEYIDKRKVKLLEMMLNPTNEKLNDRKLCWDDLKIKKKKEGI